MCATFCNPFIRDVLVKFHLIGICGTGMASLAGLLKKAGHKVKGSDIDAFPPMSIQLDMLDVEVLTPYKSENLDWNPDVVVVGNVCREDHVEVVEARERGLKLTSMAETIENRFLKKRRSIVIAGTHGKTTSSSLMAHLLVVAGRNPSYLIGGIPQNYGMSFNLGSGRDFVIEGDEYDTAFFDKESKFLHYRPKFVLLTGVEYDHADIFPTLDDVYEAFKKFVAMIPETGTLVAYENVPAEVLDVAKCKVHIYRVEVDPDKEESEKESGYDGLEGRKGGADGMVDDPCPAEIVMGMTNSDHKGGVASKSAGGGRVVMGDDSNTGSGERSGAGSEGEGFDGGNAESAGGHGNDNENRDTVKRANGGKAGGGSVSVSVSGQTGDGDKARERREEEDAADMRASAVSVNDMEIVEAASGVTMGRNVWSGRILKQEKSSGAEVFQLFSPEGRHLGTFRQTLAGHHNVLNAVGCLVLAHQLSIDWPDLADGLSSFRGVQRRQEICGVAMGVTVIDDFAHHPTAVKETLSALNSRFAGRRIIAVFEPRSATSRRKIFQEEFGEALSFADEVIVAKVFNADALSDEERLDPEELASKIRSYGARARHIREVDEIVKRLEVRTRPGDIVVFMSSGSFGDIHNKLLAAIGDPITRASLSDVEEMQNLLEPLDLAPHDLRAHFDEFLIIRGEDGLVGCVGLEARGRVGLIKCMAIVSGRRGEGLGYMMGQSALDKALDMGLSHVYMFGTESTHRIGRILGFVPFPRQEVDNEMSTSPEFERPLYKSAKLMRKDISSDSMAAESADRSDD